jgi:hypothetical protein
MVDRGSSSPTRISNVFASKPNVPSMVPRGPDSILDTNPWPTPIVVAMKAG